MTVSRPQPRPGVLSINPYVPGKSSAPGVAKMFKLSSNETPLGPSPQAIEAYRAVGEHLEDYPDGAASELREAIGKRLRPRSRPHRVRSRLRRSAEPAGARLSRRRRRGDPHHARIPGLSDRHARHRRQAGGRGGKELHRRRRRHSQGGDARRPRSSSSPIPTIRPAPMCRSTRSSGCIAGCHRTSLLVLDARLCGICSPQRLRGRHRAGRDLRQCRDVPHLLEDPRPRRAAAGLDVRACACRRRGQSHPRAVQRQRARRSRPASRRSADIAHIESARARTTTRWLAWLSEEIGKLGLTVTPSVANFVLIHFPSTAGRTAKEADAFLTARGLILRQVGGYRLPNALRMTRRQRGGQPAGGRVAGGVLGDEVMRTQRRRKVKLVRPRNG